jgi:chemotaxis protein MotB
MANYRRRETDEDDEPHKNTSLWLIIYTDMISNLMIFFLMLYCLTWLKPEDKTLAAASFKQAFAGEKKAVGDAMKDIEKGLDKDRSVEGKLREEFSNVEVSEKRITIVLPSPVLFDSGSAVLKPETKKTLHDFAEIIRGLKNKVVAEGYTDDKPINTGEYASNWELSSARAFSVIKYLTEEEHIDPERLSAFGYGEFRPKVPNDSEENRAKNRRIDINIIKG